MHTCTVAITREGHNAQMIIRVDDSGATPRICELAIRPVDGNTLGADELPAVDLDLLLRSLRPPAPARRRDRMAPPRPAAMSTSAARTAKPARARERRQSARTAAATEGRAYRRMPDDIAAVFAETGGVTAVARHYGVPRHTAQGWIGRLRRQS